MSNQTDFRADPSYIQQTQELAQLALSEAKLILKFGTTGQKMQIIRGVLSVLAKQAAGSQDAAANEMRLKMEILMASMRDVPILDKVITDTDYIDAEIVEE